MKLGSSANTPRKQFLTGDSGANGKKWVKQTGLSFEKNGENANWIERLASNV